MAHSLALALGFELCEGMINDASWRNQCIDDKDRLMDMLEEKMKEETWVRN